MITVGSDLDLDATLRRIVEAAVSLVDARYEDATGLLASVEAMLRRDGAPAAEIRQLAEASLPMISRVSVSRPDLLIQDGDIRRRSRFQEIPDFIGSRGELFNYGLVACDAGKHRKVWTQ